MPHPLRVLTIEAAEADTLLVMEALARGGYAPAWERVTTAAELQVALSQHEWDILLSDYVLPQFSARAALEIMHELGLDLPLIVVSGTAGEDVAVEVIKAGAYDFIVKSSLERLVRAVERVLREVSERRARVYLDDEMRYVLAHAQCLLWSGVVTDVNDPRGLMYWQTQVFDEEAALRFAPLDLLPGEPFTAAWYRHRLPEDQQVTDAASAAALRGNQSQYARSFRCRMCDGSIRWFNERVHIARLTSHSWRVVGVAVDITRRKQAEQERADLLEREQAARLAAERAQQRVGFIAEASALLASSLDYTTIWSRLADLCVPILGDMCIVDVHADNGELVRVASSHIDPAKAALVRELAEHFPLEKHSAHPTLRVLRTGEPEIVLSVSDELLQRSTRNAEHLQIVRALGFKSFLVVPLATQGRILGALSLVATEASRAYDAADLELAQEIAYRVAIAVDNARLYQEAQEAIRIRETFLSIAAHELRTPLTALLGHTHILTRYALREVALPERVQRSFAALHSQGNRLNDLIETLLDVSRLQHGALPVPRERVDFSALVRRIVDEVVPTLDLHTIELTCHEPLMVEASVMRLEQVLHNLLSNAVKYSPYGGVIEVVLRPEGAEARLVVTDQGVGIPINEQLSVFNQFYRATNIDPRRISGLGVGLYLVQEIVAGYGGRIEVQSAEGQGSTFVVSLPLLQHTTQPDA